MNVNEIRERLISLGFQEKEQKHWHTTNFEYYAPFLGRSNGYIISIQKWHDDDYHLYTLQLWSWRISDGLNGEVCGPDKVIFEKSIDKILDFEDFFQKALDVLTFVKQCHKERRYDLIRKL